MKHAPVLEANPLSPQRQQGNTWPVLPADAPILYEDEELGDMGEANRHFTTNEMLHICLKYFLRERHPAKRIFGNMNCYYAPGPKHKRTGSLPYISADNMIVEPFEPLSEDTVSYTIGRSGPQPLTALETLSEGTMKDTDFGTKIKLYAYLKIAEYIIVDVTGELLPEKLLLKRLQADGTWKDERDPDGGVTSGLGFRLVIDEEGDLAVLDVKTGKRYVRPDEAQAIVEAEMKARKKAEKKAREAETKAHEEAEARRLAEERIAALQVELERLRSK